MENQWIEQIQIALAENTFWSWVVLAAIAMAITFTIKFVLKLITTRLRKLTTHFKAKWENIGLDIIDGLRSWVLFTWLFYLGSKSLKQTEFIAKVLLLFAVVASAFQVILWGLYVIRRWSGAMMHTRVEKDPSSAAALGLMATIAQAVFILIVVLIGLSNLGINISAMIAGLGVGGIAVALAAQNVLGDLLASLSIVLDKPFTVGDFIVAGKELGTVEKIGLKTTRLRSLSGEELVISNKDLLESRVQNFKSMWQRRVVHKFGVTYSTPPEKLEQIPGWVRGFVEKHDKLKFDRCHFMAYGASSLDFELVFLVNDPEYNTYMDIQQVLLLDIYKKFAQEKVEFAFPSQSVYVEKLPEMAPRTVRSDRSAQDSNSLQSMT